MMHGFGYGFGGLGSFGWIGLIINLVLTVGIIIGVVLLVVWAVRRLSPSGQGQAMTTYQTPGQAPRDILQIRYARGEITREEYQQMLSDLS
ncbi:MAG TPA: SHOCT domain-containing protein [Anaerolineales bacterium]|jgi:putative membrane protein|nr:SHOCT domain-containing protein [Anaerolineales bacterium]